MLPLGIFRSRQFSAANAVTFVVYAALGGLLFLVPTVLIVVHGYSPVAAGTALLPVTFIMLALSSRSGALAARIGPRLQMSVGPVVIAASLLLFARISDSGDYLTAVLPGAVVFGFGVAIMVAPLTATALAAAPADHAGVASAVNNDVARAASLIAVAVLPALAGISGDSYLHPAALAHGFREAAYMAAVFCAAGGVLAALTIRNPSRAKCEKTTPQEFTCSLEAPPLRNAGTRHRTGRGKGSPMTTDGADAHKAVEEAARAARGTVADLAGVPGERLDQALRAIADGLVRGSGPVLAANEADMTAAREAGPRRRPAGPAAAGRGAARGHRGSAAGAGRRPYEPAERVVRELPGGLVLTERRRPVGVIGANFEARPNVVVDIASQFVKSRNAGVLRTGSAAIRSAVTLADEVIAPALASAGLDPAMIQLVRVPGQESARALVSQPGLIPLVILRGSGDSTRSLAAEAARHGVRTMAHADGGAVLYVDAAADLDLAGRLIEASLDRLGVCNRLNLLLVHPSLWDAFVPG